MWFRHKTSPLRRVAPASRPRCSSGDTTRRHQTAAIKHNADTRPARARATSQDVEQTTHQPTRSASQNSARTRHERHSKNTLPSAERVIASSVTPSVTRPGIISSHRPLTNTSICYQSRPTKRVRVVICILCNGIPHTPSLLECSGYLSVARHHDMATNKLADAAWRGAAAGSAVPSGAGPSH